MLVANLSFIGICSWIDDPVLVFQLPETDLRLSTAQTDQVNATAPLRTQTKMR